MNLNLLQIDGLNKVEQLIKEKIRSEVPILEEISNYLFDLGGKRIRPALTLLVGKTFSNSQNISYSPSQQLIDVSAGIELIHMATLLHDDIIDKAQLRRHSTSPYTKYGIAQTLLTGDYLLTRAYSLCARLDRYIIDQTEIACVELSEGEILEAPLSTRNFTLAEALIISRKKTAALFSLACKSGAHLSALDPSDVEKVGLFGQNLGIAFQIIDDILDVTADEKTLGKIQGGDIREQKPSIVNVLWLESGSNLAKDLLTQNIQIEITQIQAAITEITNSSVLEKAKKLAQEYVISAENSLLEVVKNKTKIDGNCLEMLQSLVQYALKRVK